MQFLGIRRLLTCIAISVFVAGSSSAGVIVIDFDTAANGDPIIDGEMIINQYAPFGATFAAFEDGLPALGPQAFDAFSGAGGTGNAL